ncbi:MAG: HAMP domain-containing protein [Streptosporangiales bacterium]|nr:HAMP domain-containing protein [Streptosporangiales bacterium]
MSKRSRRRSRPIRTKIVALLLVPLTSLIALWAFAAGTTFGDVRTLLNGQVLGDYAFSGEELIVALQQEREASLIYLGEGEAGDRGGIDSLRAQTDEAVAEYRRQAADESIQRKTNQVTKQWTAEALRRLDALSGVRAAIDSHQTDVVQSTNAYAEMILPLARLPDAMALTLGAPQIVEEADTLGAMLMAREVLAQEYSLLSGALADGYLTSAEYGRAVELVGTSRYVYAQVLPDMRPEDQRRYREVTSSPAAVRVRQMEDKLVAEGQPGARSPVDAGEWQAWSTEVMNGLVAMGKAAGNATIERTLPAALQIVARFGLAGLLGLIAVVVSVIVSIRIGRFIVRELTVLRRAAQELADERLPRVVERLHQGQSICMEAEMKLPSFGTLEIAQVGEAFSAVQRTAITEAENETKMRSGIRQVFVNIARRSQALLHRQLKMLDSMERRTDDPDALEDLFRLDHLATRMQRHAEGLIILSGSAPGRGWRNPVPMIDVVRAAAAEVEDYARVKVLPVAPHHVALVGPVVADVVHLLAELIENAALYSPPHTEVRVFPQLVANGFVVEIEDRGLGMSEEELASVNEMLANPPEFDLFESERLGLFVVAQLARRHQIRISMRGSPYGGTTTIVLLPPDIIVVSKDGRRAVAGADRAGHPTDGERRGTETDVPAPSRLRVESGTAADASPRALSGGLESVPGDGAHGRGVSRIGADNGGADYGGGAEGAQPEREPEPAGVAGQSGAAGGRPPLPRRVRQASLKPELRTAYLPEEEPDPDDGDRSPEEVRDLLNSMQKGWMRGRSEVDATDAEARSAGPVEGEDT